MKKLEDLIHRLNQLYDRGDLPPKVYKGAFPGTYWEAYEAAQELWEYPSYEEEITDDQLRDAYVDALFKVADYFKYAFRRRYLSPLNAARISPSRISYLAVAPLKRAYSLDAGNIVASADFSYKEIAAYKLGILYKEARCPNSAVWWFRQSLRLARAAGVITNILGNLHQLAWNLEFLAQYYKEAGQYYDEMLEVLSTVPLSQHPLDWLVHAAMYHIRHGDQARGEALMRELISANLGKPISSDSRLMPLPGYFYTALNSLVLHYIATGRIQEAIELARIILKNVKRFEEPEWVRDATHGLIARALVHMGQLDGARKELLQVYVETTTFIGQDLGQNLGLWIDVARIHVANHHYELAITAYEILAYHLGALIADRDMADTTRLRFYWLQQMAFVVHEMVSVWLTITDMQTRQAVEATVANALLQLKANLFIAIEAHKDLRFSPGDELFMANRSYAVAARKVASKPDAAEALLELEDALFRREDIERSSLEEENWMARFASEISETLPDDPPGMRSFFEAGMKSSSSLSDRSMILRFDFRQSRELGEGTLLLDYSLVSYQPPRKGLAGQSQGLRYIGIRLSKGSLRMIDLGEAEQIETLCGSLVQAVSTQPLAAEDTSGRPQNRRQLRPANWNQPKDKIDFDELNKRVYDRIVAPFEPLSRSLLFSPDGMLAALPFHALIHENRYLIEDRDIAYCHSLLQKASLSRRYLGGSVRVSPPPTRSALLLGDPNYTTSNLPPLLGTKLEVARVAKLLRTMKYKGGENVFEEVQVYTGADATVSRLLGIERPRILHIAAHGTFDEDQTRLFTAQPFTSGGCYRQVEEMGASPFTQLDNALLHSTVMLAEDSKAVNDPANGAVLTALELASLNLLGCHVVVLSACETGAGVTEYGAGVLGFQYALQASFARAALLSLWKVLDQETSAFMIDFYRKFSDQRSIKKGYLSTVRKHCRRNGQRVHPYYWAAFMFLDQEYVDPFYSY
jgi:CHAT domain-containing protein